MPSYKNPRPHQRFKLQQNSRRHSLSGPNTPTAPHCGLVREAAQGFLSVSQLMAADHHQPFDHLHVQHVNKHANLWKERRTDEKHNRVFTAAVWSVMLTDHKDKCQGAYCGTLRISYPQSCCGKLAWGHNARLQCAVAARCISVNWTVAGRLHWKLMHVVACSKRWRIESLMWALQVQTLGLVCITSDFETMTHSRADTSCNNH